MTDSLVVSGFAPLTDTEMMDIDGGFWRSVLNVVTAVAVVALAIAVPKVGVPILMGVVLHTLISTTTSHVLEQAQFF